ncbi:TraB domain-containing protein [Geodia barretti]|uniref:TraB domain-containing protein n=1 Tax=Geodia barretti TaxID=519541 RepID=A0AA35S3K4_GEOBA|nr:TraB domain-containing protein [Geodia barretti]
MSLPHTVTTLTCPNGSVVHVVGTVHFSKESVQDVRNTIASTRPQVVVLELCKDRQLILHYSEEDILRQGQSMSFSTVRNFVQRDGVVAGLTQSLFLQMSAKITAQLGVAPGGEFRAGFEEATKVNAGVVLGDRSVGITFKRAMAAMSLWKRIHLGLTLLRTLGSGLEISPEEVEAMREKDMVSMLVGELAAEMPAVAEVFVQERDKILACSLMRAANCAQEPWGPPAVVVGVVGIGHIPGIQAHWLDLQCLAQLRELLQVPVPSRTSRVVWTAVKIGTGMGLVGLTAFGVYSIIRHFTK